MILTYNIKCDQIIKQYEISKHHTFLAFIVTYIYMYYYSDIHGTLRWKIVSYIDLLYTHDFTSIVYQRCKPKNDSLINNKENSIFPP